MALFNRGTEHETGGASETIIGSSVKVEGNFVGKGNIVIEGKVSGSMKTNQDIRITEGAVVKADVEAQNVVVAGEVHGTVKAHDRLELTETARVHGDVEAKVLSIGAGALLNGKCVMISDTAPVEVHDEKQNADRMARFGKQRKQEASV